MTIEEVQDELEHIRAIRGDDEAAHSSEDDLHQEVLQYVAETAPEPWRSVAAEALKSGDIKFERWCA